jgi:hypothetical protein
VSNVYERGYALNLLWRGTTVPSSMVQVIAGRGGDSISQTNVRSCPRCAGTFFSWISTVGATVKSHLKK